MTQIYELTEREIITILVVFEDMVRKGYELTDSEKALFGKIKGYLNAE